MEKIHFIYDFDVPREKVFDFFSEHERLSEIYPGAFKRIVNSNNPIDANGLGSVRRITNFPFIIDEIITQYERPSLIEYKILDSKWVKYHKGTMHFYELHNGTSTRLDYKIELDINLPFVGFFSKNILQSAIGNALKALDKKFKDNPNF
jgi:carbon monoxide dehydrogenase subunit G